MAQPLNGAGQTRPHEPALMVDSGLGNSGVSAASAAWGSVLAARGSRSAIRLGREGDFMGEPFPFATSSQSISRVSQTGLPDGGFLIAWLLSNPQEGQSRSWARLFAADGVPTGPEFPIFDAFDVRAVEWSPLGELVAIGTNKLRGSPRARGREDTGVGQSVLGCSRRRTTAIESGTVR